MNHHKIDNCDLVLSFRGSNSLNSKKNRGSIIMLIGQIINVISTDYIPIYYLPWLPSINQGIKKGSIFFEAVINGAYLNIQMINVTEKKIIGLINVTESGFYEMDFTVPTTASRIVLRVRKTNELSNPLIYGIGLITND